MYNKQQKEFLLDLARRSIAYYLDQERLLQVDSSTIDPVLKEPRGVFVTLTLSGELRGCIGHLQPTQELYLDVIENAVNAAVNDPRFEPLKLAGLKMVNIEISVLELPRKLQYRDRNDLLAKLKPGSDGVILRQGNYEATYLPQVWDDFPSKEAFLSSLCQKAGLPPAEWEKGRLEVQVYGVENF
jgi:AmmeMemoRadiSam system protein A